MTLTRKDLREAVYRRLSKEYPPQKVSRHLVHLALEDILDLILEALCRGEPVVLHGFGRFSPRKTPRSCAQFFVTFKSSSLFNKDLP